jgi:teichuronic acid biosynthesis glycosyltransferase TuaG
MNYTRTNTLPCISIIIPSYNRAELLKNAVMSVLTQTFTNFEVIVCDDGSTDNSEELILSLNDERIKWLSLPHSGKPSVPRNHGMRKSKGEWLAFLDSDDRWFPSKLETQINILKTHKYQAISSNCFAVNNANNKSHLMININNDSFSFYELIERNLAVTSMVMFNRGLLDKVIGFPEADCLKIGEDYALWLRVASYTDFAYIIEPLGEYSDAPSESIRGTVEEMPFRSLQNVVLRNYIDWCKDNAIINCKSLMVKTKIFRNNCRMLLKKIKNLNR